jgi:hypothetical protein
LAPLTVPQVKLSESPICGAALLLVMFRQTGPTGGGVGELGGVLGGVVGGGKLGTGVLAGAEQLFPKL